MSHTSKPAKAKPNEAPQAATTSKGASGQKPDEQKERNSDIPFHLPRRTSCLDLTKGCTPEERKSNDSSQESSENDDGEEVHLKSYEFLENREVVTSLGDLSIEESETKRSSLSNTSYEPPML